MSQGSFEQLPSAGEPVSRADAYRAMLRVLEYYFRVNPDYPLGSILGDLSPSAWADGTPGDPASWSLWVKALEGKPLRGAIGRGHGKSFNTLRGFIRGEEPDEPIYFTYRATLRIHGDGVPFDEIAKCLGVKPTHVHRKGERRGPSSPDSGYRDDAWHFQPAVAEGEPLERHIEALWAVVKPHVGYVKSLKQRYRVDVFCGYRSNCDHAGVEVPHACLEMFTALEVPFGVSIILV